MERKLGAPERKRGRKRRHLAQQHIESLQRRAAFTPSIRLKVNVSSASGKSSSFTPMKMVLLVSVDSRKAAALMASKSSVLTPSSCVKKASIKLYHSPFN